MKSRSSTQSEDGNKNQSESSMSSTSSVIHMKNMSSIEGIHTFNLKPQQNLSKNPSEYSFDMQSNNSVDSRRSNSTSRVMYVEEKVKIDETKNYNSSLLNEANRIIREFIKIIEMEKGERLKYFSDRVGAKRKAKISFNSEEEISKLKQDKSYKVNERNALGVKSSEGWIYNLNIGNIMHLAPMDFDEMHLSFLPENLKQKTNSELNKDIIIEKIVYITVAYFWVGTEYRFLNSKVDSEVYEKKDSEIWHAKALHIWSTFIPSNSPLVKHITKSYIKHHLKDKIEKRKEEAKQIRIANNAKLKDQDALQNEIIFSEKKRHLQTPEPDIGEDLTLKDINIKRVVKEANPTVLRQIPKLIPSNSKIDMIKTSKLVLNLDFIPKKSKKSKFNAIISVDELYFVELTSLVYLLM